MGRPARSGLRVLVAERSPELNELVRAATSAMDPVPEVNTGTVEELGHYDVVVVGPSQLSPGRLRRLADLHRHSPATAIVLAAAGRPAGSLRDLVRVGADDLLALPVDENELALTLDRVLALAGRRRRPVVPAAREPGRVVTVTSPSGGAGKTFFATNAALMLARRGGRRVVLVDLDLQFGEVTTALRLEPRFTIADLARADLAGASVEDRLDEVLIDHPAGFSVLAAPLTPADADTVTPEHVARILRSLRERGSEVIVDTPAALSEVVLAALDHTDDLYALGTMDLPSIRNLKVFLKMLERLGFPADRVSVLINKAEPHTGLDHGEVAKLFPGGFRAVLPYGREVSRSLNTGVPLLESEPTSGVARLLREVLLDLVAEPERAALKLTARPRRFRAAHRRTPAAPELTGRPDQVPGVAAPEPQPQPVASPAGADRSVPSVETPEPAPGPAPAPEPAEIDLTDAVPDPEPARAPVARCRPRPTRSTRPARAHRPAARRPHRCPHRQPAVHQVGRGPPGATDRNAHHDPAEELRAETAPWGALSARSRVRTRFTVLSD